MACPKRHNNLDSLKRSLVKAPAEIPLETVRVALAEWPERLKACVEAEGGHFEWHYYKQKLKTIANKLFGSKSGCSVSFPFWITIYLGQNLWQDYALLFSNAFEEQSRFLEKTKLYIHLNEVFKD